MIYPNISLADWLKKYPSLKVLSRPCSNCGHLLHADRPFITKDYAGLEISDPKCNNCGKNRVKCCSMITISDKAIKEWEDIL